jgi:hypothetical protein
VPCCGRWNGKVGERGRLSCPVELPANEVDRALGFWQARRHSRGQVVVIDELQQLQGVLDVESLTRQRE